MALSGFIFLVAWLSLSAIVMVEGQETITIQLNYTGGAQTCSQQNCDANYGETFYPFYSCNQYGNSSTNPQWNQGYLYFMDPIPPNNGFVVWNFTATIYGRFDCNGSSYGTLLGVTFVAGIVLLFQLVISLYILEKA